jgi:CubicO group peptidase (beta-lactamase class C family)
MATAGLAAQLVAQGRLELDAPVAGHLPAFAAAGKGGVTLRQLLAHSSGLPAWRPYHALPGRAAIAAAACAEPLEAPPGTRALYSDVGFIALGLLLEAVAGSTLAALAEARLLRPLGLRDTFYLDAADPAAAAARAAGRTFLPTGACPHRRSVIRGEVNDANAWAMGGVAGHAGLFSTAGEVAALGQAWLDAAAGRASAIPAAVAGEFVRRDPTPGSERALGWDTPGGPTALGRRLGHGPLGAFGHLGYTGTSLWIDRDAEAVCALLTNHTHPTGISRREPIRELRRRFHDAVGAALGVAAA